MSSKKNIREYPLWGTDAVIPLKSIPKSLAMNMMVNMIETTMQTVFRVSFQITDFTPPLNVYRRTMAIDTAAFRTNGRPSGSKTIS